MNFVTACPACSTCFRVQSQQLALRQGRVRCGKCGEVFDALARLAEAPEIPQPEANIETPPAESETVGAYTYTIIDKPSDPPPAPPSQPEPELPVISDSAPVAELPEITPPRRRWQTPVVLTLLVLLACLQTIFYLRTPIAAHWPAVRPYLVAACDALSCQVPLPQQADLLVIDDTDLQEDAEYQGLLRFSGVIINQAAFTQAYPLLELTLTDMTDRPLLRRMFRPHEYLTAETDIAAGLEAGEEVPVRMVLSAADAQLGGYRAFITYAPASP